LDSWQGGVFPGGVNGKFRIYDRRDLRIFGSYRY
jgi:hypothetical protein